jgi:hypothetical protein
MGTHGEWMSQIIPGGVSKYPKILLNIERKLRDFRPSEYIPNLMLKKFEDEHELTNILIMMIAWRDGQTIC